MSHSKRNTSRPVFTAHERAMARAAWTSSQARLTRDSFLPFGSCCLCLEMARDPVSCHHGDIFCRECALANLLAQKKEIKRLQKAQELAEREVEQTMAEQDAEVRERAVKEFEMLQAGMAPNRVGQTPAVATEAGAGTSSGTSSAGRLLEPKHGTKRKFDLDAQELDRISEQDTTKTRKAMEDEKAQKPSLPSFWTPSLTPTLDPAVALAGRKKSKVSPVCPASPADRPHSFSQKHLISLKFTEEEDPQTKSTRRLCPSCMKTLSNASKPVLAKPCGHVFCQPCIARLVGTWRQDSSIGVPRCYVCDAGLDSGKRDKDEPAGKKAKSLLPDALVELKTDGTGFSAAGSSKVEKVATNFQC